MENSLIYTSVLSIKAQKEIAVSWNWYEDRLQGLGDRFLNEVKDAILKIVNNPNRYPIKYKGYR
ncbi:MAG TPA: hypothetical protein VFI29_04760 [Hanamia sp.]|nr:hypothetical protein [Hanamia sp.]